LPKADEAVTRPFTGDWSEYREGLKAYYDKRELSDALKDAKGACDPEKMRALIRSHHAVGDWRFEIIEHLRRAMRGRKVLELGCGYGYWTWHLAQVAESVVATDISENLLAGARGIVDGANVSFRMLDGSDISKAKGEFDAVVSVNMINHFPRAVASSAVAHVNERLGGGGRVFLAGEHYCGWRRRMYRKQGSEDFVSARDDARSGRVEIVDDPYEPHEIRWMVGPDVQDVFVGDSLGYWWVRYTVKEGVDRQ
jgi:SAM-dependent methyltransferase